MIVFELICSANHRFEGWFASADDFTSQKERGLLACPRCSDKSIEKLVTAKIGRSGADELAAPTAGKRQEAALATGQHLQAKLQELIDHVLAHTENVGAAFAEEARKIHYEIGRAHV